MTAPDWAQSAGGTIVNELWSWQRIYGRLKSHAVPRGRDTPDLFIIDLEYAQRACREMAGEYEKVLACYREEVEWQEIRLRRLRSDVAALERHIGGCE